MVNLTSLYLGHNNLGAAGAASLAPALSVMRTLIELGLEHNNLGAAGAASLAPALSLMTKVEKVELEGNDFTAADAELLVPALSMIPMTTKLKALGLEDHHLRTYIAAAGLPGPQAKWLAELHLTLYLRVKGLDGTDVHFKIKPTTPLRKLMDAYCSRKNISAGSHSFLFDGQRISASSTPLELEMEDDDVLDVRFDGDS
jgi:hypothetical protein